MSDPVFKVRYTATDDGFGAQAQRAKTAMESVGQASATIVSNLTGGIIGGSVVGVITTILDKTLGAIRETADLIDKARGVGLTPSEAGGLKAKASFTGLDANAALSGFDSAAVAQARALDGDPTYVDAYKRLGIGLEELAATKSKEIFFRAADALKGRTITPELQSGANAVFGASASALIPFMVKSGSGAFKADRFESSMIGQLAAWGLGWAFNPISTILNGGNRSKADIDPVSSFGYENEQQARRMAVGNTLREAELARSKLPIEKQLTDLVRQRLEFSRQMESEVNPLEKERLRARLLDTNVSIEAIKSQMATPLGGAPADVPIQRSLTDLYRSGIFTGGANLQLQVQQETLREIKQLVQSSKRIEVEV